MTAQTTARLPSRSLAGFLFAMLSLHAASASGFGMLITQTTTDGPPILAARALVTHLDNGHIFQVVEIDFQYNSPEHFLWVLPVLSQGAVTAVPCDTTDLFDRLDEESEPRIALSHRGGGDDGCACGAGVSSDLEHPDIGTHDYSINVSNLAQTVIMDFESYPDLESDLTGQGWLIPSAVERALSHYVVNDYTLVRADVVSRNSTGRACLQIEYSMSGSEPGAFNFDYQLPLFTGSSYSTENAEILVYTLDGERARPYINPDVDFSAYHVAELNLERLRTLEAGGVNYQDLFMEAVTSTDPRAFVVEHSETLTSPLDGVASSDLWLTRMRTMMTPRDMSQGDLTLEVTGHEEVSSDYEIVVAAADTSPSLLPVWAVLSVAGAVGCARRRKGRS
jgi:hypothetical protein